MRDNEPLVPVHSSERLLVEPIWVNPIDDIEGPLYQEYRREHPEYNDILVRASVADLLQQAATYLPAGYRLVMRAGHRPIAVQYKLIDKVKNKQLIEHPEATEAEALAFARQFVADPAIKLPPHCCGAAVDVDVIDLRKQQLVDFGCPMNTDDDISFLTTDKISEEQKSNRTMLVRAMQSAGFASFVTEWWHFSYGDENWANHYHKKAPIYSLIDA